MIILVQKYDKHSFVDVFNKYFHSVYIKEEKINDCNFEVQTNSRFGKIFVDQALVKSYLSKLDINKSSGYDEVNPYVLKVCSESFSIPLSIIYQQSLTNSDIPNLWKMANVSPIFKNGCKLQAINYRPVSLTSIPCKVLEKIINDNLKNYLELNNLFCNSIDILYTDFQKAFDRVPHKRLISKLCGYGIEKEMLNWKETYLSNRKQRVIIGDTKSDWLEVLSGVPQAVVNNQVDSKSLQDDINNLTEWSDKWMIHFNIKKCKIMHFGKHNKNFEYFIKDSKLDSTTNEKDIGLLISNTMK
ncbi:uncharacterized protein LOC136072344 [Hydra vulgaris]|uniref:uncharacterized protein LOC136072344 n=1 Tax=Hydra vulgaris TaxID=6087 RepID=UPI0032EA52AA